MRERSLLWIIISSYGIDPQLLSSDEGICHELLIRFAHKYSRPPDLYTDFFRRLC
jgi:hypothetical protein